MKRNIRFLLEYDGSRYYGWAKQPDQEMTIQGKMEQLLARITGMESVEVIGAGRTDAGVHARGMVCNAHLETDLPVDELRSLCNQYLPDDICVLEVKEASPRFHARYLATGKTYRYTCCGGPLKPVFERKYVWTIPAEWHPDLNAMREAAAFLTGTHDFASFCANPRVKKSTVRTVDSIEIAQHGPFLTLTYHGDGFLQHMVRILTGTLMECGIGWRTPSSIPELIEARDRKQAGMTAPASGLCLMSVDYN